MARKRDQIQIQTEVISQEEWEQEVGRPGLTVVDVYPAWSGPCTAMVGTLKKIKFELGDDMLNYVTARADDIAALEAFRNRSEPLWIFFGSGHPVFQMRGAHSPLLARKIVEELEKEKKVMAGESERTVIPLVCDSPAAVQLPPDPTAATTADEDTAEALDARRRRSELRARRALAPYGLLVLGQAAAESRAEILQLLHSRGFTVIMETTRTLSDGEVNDLLTPPAATTMAEAESAAECEPPATEEAGPSAAEPTGTAEGAANTEPADSGAESGQEGGQEGGGEEDSEATRRQAVRDKLLEGECTILALKDTEFTEEKPYRWLTSFLGRTPAPPPGLEPQAEVPPPAAGGQHGSDDAPPAEAPSNTAQEPSQDGAGAAEPPEPEPGLCVQLSELLGEAASAAVHTPATVSGQRAALGHFFPGLPRPPGAAGRLLALFPADRGEVLQRLAAAGCSVLHSGTGQLTEELAGRLVARLEGGESQVPALVATPILVAVLASDGGAALSAVASLDPLYLSDSADQAERDARLVFSAWGVQIPPLCSPGDPAETAGESGGAAETEQGAVEEVSGVAAADAPEE